MKIEQIYSIVNNITQEVTGKTDIVAEDLSNIVDVGKEIFDNTAVDNYVKKLVNHIGKVIFVNREYRGTAPSVLMDSWEYGSVLEKVQADIPQAVENSTWNLTNGTTYDPNVFYQPQVSAKFFNNKSTFEIPMSFTELQVKESFSNASQLNGFMSMIYNAISRSMSLKTDGMVMRTINNMTATTLNAAFPDGAYTGTATNAINLKVGNPAQTADFAAFLKSPEALRYASYQIALTIDRMRKMSTLFNVGKKERFTPSDLCHVILLSDFAKASDVYLESDTYHNELVRLPNYESVPFWQGSGTTYSSDKTSAINVTVATSGETSKTVSTSGIVGVAFDRDALGVCNYNERVTTNYNAKAEFYNNFYKFDCGYFNDANENFVVFYYA